MVVDAQTQKSVLDSFTRLMTAYSNGKIDDAMAQAASDDDILLIEPGPNQVWVGRDQVRQGIQLDWDTTEGEMPIEIGRTWVGNEGNVAWISGETKINIHYQGRDLDLPGRFTAVAKRQGNDWKWHTIHIGAPDPRHERDEAWPSKS